MDFRINDLEGRLLYGGVLIDLIHDFLHEKNGERLIAIPSLGFDSPGFLMAINHLVKKMKMKYPTILMILMTRIQLS